VDLKRCRRHGDGAGNGEDHEVDAFCGPAPPPRVSGGPESAWCVGDGGTWNYLWMRAQCGSFVFTQHGTYTAGWGKRRAARWLMTRRHTDMTSDTGDMRGLPPLWSQGTVMEANGAGSAVASPSAPAAAPVTDAFAMAAQALATSTCRPLAGLPLGKVPLPAAIPLTVPAPALVPAMGPHRLAARRNARCWRCRCQQRVHAVIEPLWSRK